MVKIECSIHILRGLWLASLALLALLRLVFHTLFSMAVDCFDHDFVAWVLTTPFAAAAAPRCPFL